MNLEEAIKKAREGKKRNFKQTFDLSIGLKNLDMKKPENKIKADITLPHGLGKPVKIGVIVDNLIPQTKDIENIIVIKKNEVEKYRKNKKALKGIASQCKFFVAETPLMPLVGKNMGQVLAVRGKMPKPIPPTLPNLKAFLSRISFNISFAIKNSPVIHLGIGAEEFDDKKIKENTEAALKVIMNKLPKGRDQIRNMYIKLTMGKPVRFEL